MAQTVFLQPGFISSGPNLSVIRSQFRILVRLQQCPMPYSCAPFPISLEDDLYNYALNQWLRRDPDQLSMCSPYAGRLLCSPDQLLIPVPTLRISRALPLCYTLILSNLRLCVAYAFMRDCHFLTLHPMV